MKRCFTSLAIAWIAVLAGITASPAGEKNPVSDQKVPANGDRANGDRLVIHEWGTFTCLQDEAGHAVAGVNTDDEPVPAFVHRISDLIPRPSQLAPVYGQGSARYIARCGCDWKHRSFTFTRPKVFANRCRRQRIRVPGGWLTEYYPAAHVTAPAFRKATFDLPASLRKRSGLSNGTT